MQVCFPIIGYKIFSAFYSKYRMNGNLRIAVGHDITDLISPLWDLMSDYNLFYQRSAPMGGIVD